MENSKARSQSLEREFDALAKARDELRVQLKLAKADARDEWRKLENSWHLVEGEMKRISNRSKAPAKEIGTAARDLIKELKVGYRRIRSQIEHEVTSHRN